MAARILASSNGGVSRLTIRLMLTPVGRRPHTAFGAPLATSFMSGMVTSESNVRSNSPATKARMRVERLGMMRHSTASR